MTSLNTSPTIEPIKVVALALQAEMGLSEGQLMLGLENWEIPKNTGLYIALSYGVETVIGNNNYNSTDEQQNYNEIQDVIMLHQIEIDVMSFDSSARLRKEEVLQAIQSYAAQQLMEQYQMRLAATPGSFSPIITMEQTKQLNRFQITITVNALHRKVKTTPFYDSIQPVDLVENP